MRCSDEVLYSRKFESKTVWSVRVQGCRSYQPRIDNLGAGILATVPFDLRTKAARKDAFSPFTPI